MWPFDSWSKKQQASPASTAGAEAAEVSSFDSPASGRGLWSKWGGSSTPAEGTSDRKSWMTWANPWAARKSKNEFDAKSSESEMESAVEDISEASEASEIEEEMVEDRSGQNAVIVYQFITINVQAAEQAARRDIDGDGRVAAETEVSQEFANLVDNNPHNDKVKPQSRLSAAVKPMAKRVKDAFKKDFGKAVKEQAKVVLKAVKKHEEKACKYIATQSDQLQKQVNEAMTAAATKVAMAGANTRAAVGNAKDRTKQSVVEGVAKFMTNKLFVKVAEKSKCKADAVYASLLKKQEQVQRTKMNRSSGKRYNGDDMDFVDDLKSPRDPFEDDVIPGGDDVDAASPMRSPFANPELQRSPAIRRGSTPLTPIFG
jgi:hypothetical protein